jgi:hypothetical protein
MLRAVGIFLEVMGAFLLAAEAIKTQNLKAIAERLRKVMVELNPFNDSEKWRDWQFLLTMTVLGTVVMLLSALTSKSGHPTTDDPIAWFAAYVVCVVIGAGTAAIIVYTLRVVVHTIDWTERNTTSGIVGIVGFLSLVAAIVIREAAH